MHDSPLFCFLTVSFIEEKANLGNKLLGKNGIEELFQGKTSLRKAKLQKSRVTPLKAGKEKQLKDKHLNAGGD